MKNYFFIIGFILFLTSCQELPKNQTLQNSPAREISSEVYTEQIRAEKKRQAELDLPFRGFEHEKEIKIIAFGKPDSNCWAEIEKNKPDLVILTDLPDKGAKTIPEYRSVREKVPFMCNPNEEVKSEYLKEWPYAKQIIPENQNGTYHSKIFGNKKNQLQVIIVDQLETENKWTWLESELKKSTPLKILSGPLQNKDRLYKLIKKNNIKNLILLPSQGSISGLEKLENFNSVYQVQSTQRLPSSDSDFSNFGIIKMNWSTRSVQFKITRPQSENNQVVDIKF